MATATATAPKTRKARTDRTAGATVETILDAAAAAPSEALASALMAAAIAAAAAPAAPPAAPPDNMQGALDAPPAAPPAAPKPPAAPADELTAILADLRKEMESKGTLILGWFITRGRLVRKAINCKVRRAVNPVTRKEYRKSALAAAQVTAADAYDAACEPTPDVDFWNALVGLVDCCAAAANIPSPSAARACIPMTTRVEGITTYNESETYVVKDAYKGKIDGVVKTICDRKITTYEDARLIVVAAIGVTSDAAPKVKTSDPVKAGRQTAERIAKTLGEGKIQADAFFEDLAATASRYGWLLERND